MKHLESNIIKPKTEENIHKSRCAECPAYNECMGFWLEYFTGK